MISKGTRSDARSFFLFLILILKSPLELCSLARQEFATSKLSREKK